MELRMTRQVEIDESAIANANFSLKSRDDIPKILRGLQHIYMTKSLRELIFGLLESKILPEVDHQNGRPGMALWKIFVMGVLRLDLNCDYDRLHELVNHHDTLRQILGHSDACDKSEYHFQTIKDNVCLLTPSLLAEINELIVKAGHTLLSKKKGNEALRGRCDSFVVETNVHYPTDISLLYDAMRKVIELTASLSIKQGLSDWRQSKYNVRQIKRQVRLTQNKKRIFGRTGTQKLASETAMKESHATLLTLSEQFLKRSELTVTKIGGLPSLRTSDLLQIEHINFFVAHAVRQIQQIRRRVLDGEIIPHAEKVFSLFEPQTEWISKGKVGVPFELGLRVCVMEDQHQFILHHQVMEKETDDQIAVSMVEKTKKPFPKLLSCSFDRGFHSANNQIALSEHLDVVALKRKGKLSEKARAIEHSEPFKRAAHKHSAIESAINALEVHGLDKCRDHGIDGFKRYVGLAIVARNIHRIGTLLHQREEAKLAHKNKCYRKKRLLLAA